MKNCFVTSYKDSYCICDVSVTVTLQKHYLSTRHNSPLKRTLKINKEVIKLFKLHLLLHAKNWETFHHFFHLSFVKLHLLLYAKNWETFHHLFHLSFEKVLYESVLFFIIKVPYKDVLLSIITCPHLSMTYHTQKYFIKAYYYLAKIKR